jgi:16S rRNA (cytidine1402-2'-O)-methyltransferase
VSGKIFLIPVTLGGDDFRYIIPEGVLVITSSLRYFIVENIRSARRYLRLIDKDFPINDSVFFELNEHTKDSEIIGFLSPAQNGYDIGLLSEAGLPGIADPGSKLVEAAHKKDIKVIPLSGPSSIIMALISSGLNGQHFAFHGYLPVKPEIRNTKLREIESRSKDGETQIFMETPYRNQKMVEAVLLVCQPDTKLCIASDISLPTEDIRTKKISEWRKNIPALNNRLVVFLIQG